jgi:hypothetical protein
MDFIGGVRVCEEIRGVQVVTLSQLSDALFTDKKSYEIDYCNELLPAVKEWAKANKSAIYFDFNEDFSIFKGVRKALDEGLSVVVVDNLS